MTVEQVVSINRSYKNLNSLQNDSNLQINDDAKKNKIKLINRLSSILRLSLSCPSNVIEIKCKLRDVV